MYLDFFICSGCPLCCFPKTSAPSLSLFYLKLKLWEICAKGRYFMCNRYTTDSD